MRSALVVSLATNVQIISDEDISPYHRALFGVRRRRHLVLGGLGILWLLGWVYCDDPVGYIVTSVSQYTQPTAGYQSISDEAYWVAVYTLCNPVRYRP